MSLRSRIVIAELLGTMILVLGGPGTVIFAQFLGFNVGVLGVALAFGLSLLCAAFLFGGISGCHINPAVGAVVIVFPIVGGAVAAGLWRVLAPGDEIAPSPAA